MKRRLIERVVDEFMASVSDGDSFEVSALHRFKGAECDGMAFSLSALHTHLEERDDVRVTNRRQEIHYRKVGPDSVDRLTHAALELQYQFGDVKGELERMFSVGPDKVGEEQWIVLTSVINGLSDRMRQLNDVRRSMQ